MKIAQLKRRIERAESLLEGREQQVVEQVRTLKHAWRTGWTPGRVVLGGLGLGFLAGLSEPAAALGSVAGKLSVAPKLLQMISTVSALFTASQLNPTADTDASATSPTQAAAGVPRAPHPAEAATEMSES